MAARFRIVILDKPEVNNPNRYRYLFWADVPTARQPFFARAGAVSTWKDAIAADNTALQNGSVVERVDTIDVPQSATVAQIQTFLETRWVDFQNTVTNINLWTQYGRTWNGTTWVAGGVA